MDLNIVAMLEALLFSKDQTLSLKDLAGVTGLSEDEVKEYLQIMTERYRDQSRGIMLKEYDGGYLLVTKECFAGAIQELHVQSQSSSLSPAALETLAIIAYKQPVTRAEIEEIRGVKAEKTLLTLSKYGLIHELGRKDSIGNPIVYGTTKKFLQHFDLQDLSQLPEPEDPLFE